MLELIPTLGPAVRVAWWLRKRMRRKGPGKPVHEWVTLTQAEYDSILEPDDRTGYLIVPPRRATVKSGI